MDAITLSLSSGEAAHTNAHMRAAVGVEGSVRERGKGVCGATDKDDDDHDDDLVGWISRASQSFGSSKLYSAQKELYVLPQEPDSFSHAPYSLSLSPRTPQGH